MWYEILPSFIAVVTFMSIPNIYVYFSNKLLLGQPYKRCLQSPEDSFHYLRDGRVSETGFTYDYTGLDNIPDLDEPKKGEEPPPKC